MRFDIYIQSQTWETKVDVLKIFGRRIERKGGGEEDEEEEKNLRKYLLASLQETIRVPIVETGLNIYAYLRIYGRNASSKLLFPIYIKEKFFFSNRIHTRLILRETLLVFFLNVSSKVTRGGLKVPSRFDSMIRRLKSS